MEFGHYTGPDDDLKSIYTNSRAIGYYGCDELGASVGRTRIYSVPKGTVKKTEDRLKGSVYSVSLFILDSYSFETRQELAYFRLPDRILPPQAFEPMPFMLGCNTDWFFATNALYRACRNATGKGEDLIVFSCSPDILLEYPGEAVFFDFPLAQ